MKSYRVQVDYRRYMSNKHNRPTVKTQTVRDSAPAPIGDLLPPLAGLNPSDLPKQFDAHREPDFAGPDGPARFSRRPIFDAVVPPGCDPPVPATARADAATGQPASATMPSGPERGLPAGDCWVELDELWFDRLELLAGRAGVDATRYVEGLIKAKWVLGPMDHPVPR